MDEGPRTAGVGHWTARIATVLLLAALECAPPATVPLATPSAVATSELANALRSRGTVVVSLRVEGPPGGRTPQDPAHGRKRAFEAEVATLVAKRIFGEAVRVELRGTGGADRVGGVERGEADLAMTISGEAGSDRVLLSDAYAAGGIVVAAPADAPVKDLADLRGQTIAVAQDELGAREIADRVLRERSIAVTLQNALGVLGAADAVTSGRAAALIGDRIGVEVLAQERPGSLRIVAELAPSSYVIAVRRSNAALVAAVNKALRELSEAGDIRGAAARAQFPYEAPRRP